MNDDVIEITKRRIANRRNRWKDMMMEISRNGIGGEYEKEPSNEKAE